MNDHADNKIVQENGYNALGALLKNNHENRKRFCTKGGVVVVLKAASNRVLQFFARNDETDALLGLRSERGT
eukprot:CAMPEP_0116578726 /NCGR_PEP_ID=MMETSP0397-20121206/21867_1 /TAXON_ID=216820 /ORGANISM="Cyclophora tenuis, Strain ECT3854" /LENGTH=71 /DNA_ID=CAMNT_0004108149 /DNA_START=674 /DNA_END=889 /DNA_ORIENTATION=+